MAYFQMDSQTMLYLYTTAYLFNLHVFNNSYLYFELTMYTTIHSKIDNQRLLEILFNQVHALNIPRVLYKDTRLGEDVIPYIAEGVRASVLGFAAQLWGVSNTQYYFYIDLSVPFKFYQNKFLQTFI